MAYSALDVEQDNRISLRGQPADEARDGGALPAAGGSKVARCLKSTDFLAAGTVTGNGVASIEEAQSGTVCLRLGYSAPERRQSRRPQRVKTGLLDCGSSGRCDQLAAMRSANLLQPAQGHDASV